MRAGAKSGAAEAVCAGCASRGRVVRAPAPGALRDTLALLAPSMPSADVPICWECSAVLHRVRRFQCSVLRSQQSLLEYSQTQNPSALTTTSRLHVSQTDVCELPPGTELLVKEELKVRLDPSPEVPATILAAPDVKIEAEVGAEDTECDRPSEDECLINFKSERKLRKGERGRVARSKLAGAETKTEVRGGKRRKVPPYYKCKVCGSIFETRGAYEYHKERHLDKPQCEECGRTFVSKSVLWQHRKLEHSDSTRYPCAACKRVYFTEAGYRAHAARHGGAAAGDQLYCQPCGKFFKSNSSLRKHQRSALRHARPETWPFGCGECERRFPSAERAREHHDVIHLSKNKFACQQCPREYCTARALRIHERVKHEQLARPRDKVCEVCGKGFQTSQVLASHLRTHTGERPYACARCPSRFAQSGALHTHTRLVHLNMKRAAKKRVAAALT